MGKIALAIVQYLEKSLETNAFSNERADEIEERLSRLTLYRNLFPTELEANKNCSAEEIQQIFAAKFPPEVVEDRNLMTTLTSLSLRIEKLHHDLWRKCGLYLGCSFDLLVMQAISRGYGGD